MTSSDDPVEEIVVDADVQVAADWPAANATGSPCGNSRMCCATFPCTPRTGPIRSQGLSGLRSIARAHSMTVRTRWRSFRAVVAFSLPDQDQANALSRASFSETEGNPPRPSSVRRQGRRAQDRPQAPAPKGLG